MNHGEKFNMLTAIREMPDSGPYMWVFQCDCGLKKIVQHHKVQSGHTKSCGCLRKSALATNRSKRNAESILKQSMSLKMSYATGKAIANVRTDGSLFGFKGRNRDEILETNRRIGDEAIGIPNPPGPSAKGPENMFSKYWQLRTPNMNMIEGWNLNELIRTHAHLFSPSDLNWKGPNCRASRGLRNLFVIKDGKPKAKFWKGWTIGDRREDSPLSSESDSKKLSMRAKK